MIDISLFRDDAQDSLTLVEGQELHVGERSLAVLVCKDDGYVLAHAGQDLGRGLEDVVNGMHPLPEPIVDERHIAR